MLYCINGGEVAYSGLHDEALKMKALCSSDGFITTYKTTPEPRRQCLSFKTTIPAYLEGSANIKTKQNTGRLNKRNSIVPWYCQ
jgi:hypothetical protein